MKTLRGPSADHHTSLLILGVLLCSVAASVASFDYLPTHDGPQHVYTIHASNHLDDVSNGYARWFEANTPISGNGFAVLFAPLDRALGWKTALRVALVMMTGLWVLGAYCFVAAVHPGRRWVGVALGAAAFQWSLYMGFFAFYVGSGFGLFVLAFAFGRTSEARPRLGWIAALLFVQALLHLMAAVVTGLVIASLLWMRGKPRERVAQLGRIIAVGLPALCVVLLTVWVSRSAGSGAHAEPSAVTPGPWWILAKCFMGGPWWRAWPLTAMAVCGPVLAFALRRNGSEHSSAEDRALWLAGGVLLSAAAFFPLHLPYWEFFSVRFLPVAVCALAATLPVEKITSHSRYARTGVVSTLCGFAFASTSWAFSYHTDLADRGREALSGLELSITRPGARLPILLDVALNRPYDEFDAMMPYVAPLANLGKLYATSQGGFVPEVFAVDPAIHSALLTPAGLNMPVASSRYVLALSDPANRDDLALREAVTVYLAAHATYYDDIIFLGEPRDVEHLKWLGFSIEWQNEGLAIGRFKGCPLTVRVPASSLPLDSRTLEVGWAPALGVTHRYPFAKARRGEGNDLVFALRQTCGEAWLRIAGPGDAEMLACEGADADGRLSVGIGRTHPEVECRVGERISSTAR